ncbi:Canalicular multispecific organic anion transporter 1 [Coemansia sp. RSA 2320]|nr:Canalicular multispecific organic anion transporter 1 [Coemansia sp. RSA 2320]
MATQCVKAYALYYSESLRTELMTDNDPATMLQSLKYYLVVNALVQISRHQIGVFETWIRTTLWARSLLEKMRVQVIDTILTMPLTVLESIPQSRMIDLFYRNKITLFSSLPLVLCHYIFNDSLSAISAIAQVVKLSPGLILLCAPFVAGYYALSVWYGNIFSDAWSLCRAEITMPLEKLEEIIACGRQPLRIHGVTERFLDKLNRFGYMRANHEWHTKSIQGSRELATALLNEAIKTTVLAFKLYQQLYLRISVSAGEVDATTNLALNFYHRTGALVAQNKIDEFYIRQISAYFEGTSNVQREKPRVIESNRPPPNWPEAGEIEFQRLCLRYKPEGTLVLNNLSFAISSKEKIGIVGRTGAGKSSLTYALLRLVEADSGSIIIDGIDISTIGLSDLRSRISIIPQDPALFQGTIRDNLDPLHQYTDDEVWSAIKACQIGDLMEVPTDKYTKKPSLNDDDDDDADSDLGEWIEGTGLAKWVEYNGSNFSVGQRQLVSLCRALLWRRKILILDEATANVDSKTDKIMQAVIRREFADCTVLTIAHRLNTIMDSDRILVMDQGEIAEFDTPANLLAQNSHFTRLVECVDLNHSHQPPSEK